MSFLFKGENLTEIEILILDMAKFAHSINDEPKIKMFGVMLEIAGFQCSEEFVEKNIKPVMSFLETLNQEKPSVIKLIEFFIPIFNKYLQLELF